MWGLSSVPMFLPLFVFQSQPAEHGQGRQGWLGNSDSSKMGERWDNINNGRIYKNTKTLQQDKNISALYNFATVIIMTIFVYTFLKNEKKSFWCHCNVSHQMKTCFWEQFCVNICQEISQCSVQSVRILQTNISALRLSLSACCVKLSLYPNPNPSANFVLCSSLKCLMLYMKTGWSYWNIDIPSISRPSQSAVQSAIVRRGKIMLIMIILLDIKLGSWQPANPTWSLANVLIGELEGTLGPGWSSRRAIRQWDCLGTNSVGVLHSWPPVCGLWAEVWGHWLDSWCVETQLRTEWWCSKMWGEPASNCVGGKLVPILAERELGVREQAPRYTSYRAIISVLFQVN